MMWNMEFVVLNYLDDFKGVEYLSKSKMAFDSLRIMLRKSGFEEAIVYKKLGSHQNVQFFLVYILIMKV